jgi:hypothetical protein
LGALAENKKKKVMKLDKSYEDHSSVGSPLHTVDHMESMASLGVMKGQFSSLTFDLKQSHENLQQFPAEK